MATTVSNTNMEQREDLQSDLQSDLQQSEHRCPHPNLTWFCTASNECCSVCSVVTCKPSSATVSINVWVEVTFPPPIEAHKSDHLVQLRLSSDSSWYHTVGVSVVQLFKTINNQWCGSCEGDAHDWRLALDDRCPDDAASSARLGSVGSSAKELKWSHA